jgi:phosphotransferase system enzyme I (PtsI)
MKSVNVELVGKSVSGGVAVGRVEIRLEDPSIVPVYRLRGEAEIALEIELFGRALEEADREAGGDVDWAKGNLPASEAEIFRAQRAILRDPSLREWVEGKIRDDRLNAAAAVRQRFDEFRAILRESKSEIIRNRVLDVTDAERLILAHVLGTPSRPGAQRFDSDEPTGDPIVLVTNNPPPSLLARIDPERVAGVVCEAGAGMGHVAVLARALDLPALIQVDGLLAEARDGDAIAVDADEGKVLIRPDERRLAEVRRREHRRRVLRPPRPADPRAGRVTADGLRISLRGNAASQREVDAAAQVDADGVGLYRTEFLYLARNRLPTESELVAVYSAAARSFARDPVDIRLLDLGSDKHLPGTQAPAERNPALGLRSLRFLFEHPEILRTQIRAVLQAAADGPVRLLLPMVGTVTDVRRIRETVAACHEELRREGLRHDPDLALGAMIEHPSGLLLAPSIFREVDFASVGSNDLTMYLLATDRDSAHLAPYYDPLHPAVIRALKTLVLLAEETQTPLSICGEIAADPSMTGVLLGLGFTRLSMSPQWILPVGLSLPDLEVSEWRELMDQVLELGTADEVRKAVREFQAAPES